MRVRGFCFLQGYGCGNQGQLSHVVTQPLLQAGEGSQKGGLSAHHLSRQLPTHLTAPELQKESAETLPSSPPSLGSAPKSIRPLVHLPCHWLCSGAKPEEGCHSKDSTHAMHHISGPSPSPPEPFGAATATSIAMAARNGSNGKGTGHSHSVRWHPSYMPPHFWQH